MVNTLLIRSYVFLDSKYSMLKDMQLSFLSNGLVYVVGTVFILAIIENFEANPYVAKLTANCLTFLSNCAIRNIFFRKK